MDTLYTFWDNTTHYKTESVHFWGLMNSATKLGFMGCESDLWAQAFSVDPTVASPAQQEVWRLADKLDRFFLFKGALNPKP